MLVDARRGARLRLRGQRRAGRDRARPRLLARRGNARRVLRRPHGPDLGAPRSSTSTTASGRSYTWPDPLPPAKFVFDEDGRRGHALDSMVCAGVVLSGGVARRSVLSPGVHLHSYAEVEDSILMHGADVGRGAVVRRAIVDKDVRIAPGARDRRRPGGRSRALHGVGRRHRRDPQGRGRRLRVALLTREYPPEVYGGAGVHVEYLARELGALEDVTVHAWGTGDVHHHAWERARRRCARRWPRSGRCRST